MTAKDKQSRFAQAVRSAQEVARKVRAITNQPGTSIQAQALMNALNGLRESGTRLQANLALAMEAADGADATAKAADIDAMYNAVYRPTTTGVVAQIATADAVQGAAIRAAVEANSNAVGSLIASRCMVYNATSKTFEPGSVKKSEITDLLAKFADLEGALAVVPEE